MDDGNGDAEDAGGGGAPDSVDEQADDDRSDDGNASSRGPHGRSAADGVEWQAATSGDEPLGDLADATDRRSAHDRPDPGGEDDPDSRARDDEVDPAGPDDSDASDPGDSGRADAPLGDLATSIDRRRDRARDAAADDLFTQEDVREIDPDVVWDRLEDDEPIETPAGEREVRVVEKDSYCEGCPYFSQPPAVGCDHEGTQIIELVDVEHFRVVDCPKVRETEHLESL